MKSKVYYIDSRATFKKNLLHKIGELLHAAELDRRIHPRDLVAVKLHFGEEGNTGFIRPVFVRNIVKTVRNLGGFPFLTDTNTLYTGARSDSPHHLSTAVQNGFAYSVVQAPVIIADGLRGKNEIAVLINKNRFKRVFIGAEIDQADALISLAHFTGHDFAGFGGTIKNLGMGCASRRGKMAQHSGVAPKVKLKRCIGCGECIPHCTAKAVSLVEQKASIDPEKCIGCGQCFVICQNEAIRIRHQQSTSVFMENMAEYALGVLKNKKDRAFFVNFVLQVSPGCDCAPFNDTPIVGDIGIMAASDPVAIDQAAVDLVNRQPALPGSCLDGRVKPGDDKFKGLYPRLDWSPQLDHAERLGLGRRDYELVTVD
jgi:uncharacterized Fe-S center protein